MKHTILKLIKKHDLTHAITLAWCFCFSVLSFIICYQVIPNDIDYKTSNEVAYAISNITGTIVAIVFSMILSISTNIANSYSTKYLRYVLRNVVYIISILCAVLLMLFCLIPNQIDTFDYTCLSIAGFVLFLSLFIFSLIETMKMMHISESILKPESKNIQKWLEKAINDTEKQQILSNGLKRASSVPEDIEQELEGKTLPIRDIIIGSITNNNLKETVDAIGIFTDIALAYLRNRKNFYGDQDKFIYFVYTEFQNIATTSLKTGYLHLRVHPFLIESQLKISEEALNVNVNLSESNGNNHLLSFPVLQIRQLCLENRTYSNSSAPSLACEALERIGLSSIEKGFIGEASSIVTSLSQISCASLKLGSDMFFLSYRANIAIMRILSKAVINRESLLNKRFSETSIMTMIVPSIEIIMEHYINETKKSEAIPSPLEPIVCELADIPKHITTLDVIVGQLIYAQNNPMLINYGLQMILNSIYYRVFFTAFNNLDVKQKQLSDSLIDTLYRSQLVVISLFNDKLRNGIADSPTENNHKELNLKTARDIISGGLNILWRFFMKQKAFEGNNNHVLDALFSLVIICLSPDTVDKPLLDTVESFVKKTYQIYGRDYHNPNEPYYKYCRMLNLAIKKFRKNEDDFLKNIPEYKSEEDTGYFEYSGFTEHCDANYPQSDFIDMPCCGEGVTTKQWVLLGSYPIKNSYFDELNKTIWES